LLSVFAGASAKLAQVGTCRPFFFFFLVAKMGVTVRGGPNGKCGNWGKELNRVLALWEQELSMNSMA